MRLSDLHAGWKAMAVERYPYGEGLPAEVLRVEQVYGKTRRGRVLAVIEFGEWRTVKLRVLGPREKVLAELEWGDYDSGDEEICARTDEIAALVLAAGKVLGVVDTAEREMIESC